MMLQRWWQVLKDQLISLGGQGAFRVGKGTYISEDAHLNGNIIIGDNCLIGTGVIIRGNVIIGDNVRLGYGVEVKNSVIKDNTTVGPLCYLGDSLVERNVYLGALVKNVKSPAESGEHKILERYGI